MSHFWKVTATDGGNFGTTTEEIVTTTWNRGELFQHLDRILARLCPSSVHSFSVEYVTELSRKGGPTKRADMLKVGDEFDEGGFWWKVTSLDKDVTELSKEHPHIRPAPPGHVLVGGIAVERSDTTDEDKVEWFKRNRSDEECFESYMKTLLMNVRKPKE